MVTKNVTPVFKSALKGGWGAFRRKYNLAEILRTTSTADKKLQLIYEHGFKDGYEAKEDGKTN